MARPVAARLEQHRVQGERRAPARSDGLEPLRPADLAAVRSQTIELFDMFCALNGATRTRAPAATAEPGHDDALACVRGGSGNEQARGRRTARAEVHPGHPRGPRRSGSQLTSHRDGRESGPREPRRSPPPQGRGAQQFAALRATTMVDSDMRRCTDRHGQHEPDRGQDAGRERHRDEVVAGGPPQVLLHLAVAGPGQLDHRQHRARVVAGQDDAGRRDGDVGAGADGDADIGLRQRGRRSRRRRPWRPGGPRPAAA